METLEVTFLEKKYFFQTDKTEEFTHLCNQLSEELDQLYEDYSYYGREQILLLYILRKLKKGSIHKVKNQESQQEELISKLEEEDVQSEEIKDEQLGVDLEEIDNLLNSDI